MTPPNSAPDERMGEIERRAEKATVGPWLYRPRPPLDDWGIIRAAAEDGYIVAQARDAGATDEKQKDNHRRRKTDPYEANGLFIAHARDDIPWLLAQHRALIERVTKYRKRLQVDRHFEAIGDGPLREVVLPFDQDETEDKIDCLEIENKVLSDEVTALTAQLERLKTALSIVHDKAKTMRNASKLQGPREYEDRQDFYRVWVKANYKNGKGIMAITSAALAQATTDRVPAAEHGWCGDDPRAQATTEKGEKEHG